MTLHFTVARVTMRDVARAAGVSPMTVSRALNRPDMVAAGTRTRIEAAVARLGYVPDRAAGTLASGRSRLVAAVLSTLAGSIFVSTVDGLGEALRAANHQLLLGTTDYSPTSAEELVAVTLSRRPDGLVLTSGSHTARTRHLLRRAGVPIVEIWELVADPIDMVVGFSNRAAGRAMTRALHEFGYRRIAFLGGLGPDDPRGSERLEGYREAQAALGGSARQIAAEQPVPPIELGARGLARLLDAFPDTDAVFCASDPIALGALMEARRRGLEVPRDLAVAGLGDFEYAGDSGLGLTTLSIPGHRIGQETARLILARKSGEVAGAARVDVGFELVRRATA